MQNWKLTISLMLVLNPVSFQVFSAESSVSSADAANTTESIPTPVQEHIIQMMQNDITFDAQKRELSNELELEKIRSEINKLKEDNEPISVEPVRMPEVPEPIQAEVQRVETVQAVALPKVVLVTEIAGVSRVAVSSGDGVKMVRLNEKFTQEGHQFIVSNSGRGMPTVREITK
ncbi:hypothetical protein ERD95_13140 [Enterobacteriaceae bacterium ML5]|mgnify:CR=1 FL=1|nr:hypothetical protein ASE99_13450 [Serratia sp. Leaf51]THD48771.1 hypothetical protein ERD95_13140 [Enterobacteriaceae bacterium ML5]